MSNKRRVGVFIPHTYPYVREILEGIGAFCQVQEGWKLAVALGDEKNMLAHLANHLDGLIAGVGDAEFVAALNKWGKPYVDIFNNSSIIGNSCNVLSDMRAEGRLGAKHLIDLGFQHFAYCGFESYWYLQLRQQGFVNKVRKMGGSCHIHQVPSTLDWPSVWKGVADWVAGLPKPIGLMAAKDSLAVDVLNACSDLGIQVPDQVAVVGVGNNITPCQQSKPPLSSVDPGFARIGFQAARCLEAMMSGKPVPNRTILLQPVGVACRASTDTLSLADTQMAKVLRHIREHACDPMQVNDLLSIVPLSRRCIELRFVEARGHSLHEEIRHIQLQKAMELLTQTYLPLEEVARASGFGSPGWMVRVFHKELGITPGEHRRRCGTVRMAAHA